jgi:Complex I intermediate-associated protein 30 (CIA30)
MAWDLGRFVQTLSYFEEVPVVSWVQKMFQPSLPPPQPVMQPQVTGDVMRFDFRLMADLSSTWGAVDDVVMGGISESQIASVPEGALFSGNVSTANSGGFVSVRTRNFEPALDLSAAQGLQLRVKGDGQHYKFLLRSDVGWDSVAFAFAFDTIAAEWLTVLIPFAELRPVFRAKTLPPDVVVNLAKVRSLQLMLSKFEYDGGLNPKFQPGQFSLVVESIATYGNSTGDSVQAN